MIRHQNADDHPATYSSWWLFLLLALFLWGACCWGFFEFLDSLVPRVLLLLSRDSVFFCTPTEPFYVLLELFIVFPFTIISLVLGLLILPSARENLKKRPEGWAVAVARVIPARWMIAGGTTYLLMVVLYLFALSSNVCLSDSELYYRPSIFYPMEIYRLSEVAEVRSICRKERRGWYTQLEIRMTDDSLFDLTAVKPIYDASSERIRAMLRGIPQNTVGMSPACPIEDKVRVIPR